jgi:imidazolonepropionase-like amidohydrolase
MASCLRGETKVFLMANDLEAIRSAVQWAVRNELDPVIVGGRDSDLCTDLLRRHDVEVVIGSVFGTPRRRDSDYDEAFRLPKILHDAGVKFCIGAGGGATKARDIPFHAGMAVGFGLEEDEAIKAITLYSARALGVDDRVGSLEIGKDATLIVTNGSPLDLTTDVEMAFISGRKVDLRSKHTELDRKYREKYRQIKDKK